jgi:hypothetical protein
LFLIYFNAFDDRAKKVNLKSTSALLLAMIQVQEQAEILKEIEALCSMHEKISQASECREFNRRVALLLQRLEDAGWSRLADRAMSLLAACNPKDLSQCDSIQQARETLVRLREMAKEKSQKNIS